MLVSEAILEIRNKTNDRDEVGLEDEEILSYLNEAIQYAAELMVANNHTLLVHDMVLEKEASLPSGFVKFAGSFPVSLTGTKMELLDEPPVAVRYFALPGRVELDGDMPFDSLALNQAIIKAACIYIDTQEQLDVQQDKALSDEINSAIAAAIA